jgi:hypothetical protein
MLMHPGHKQGTLSENMFYYLQNAWYAYAHASAAENQNTEMSWVP